MAAFPLHEYWLEHKRVLAIELAQQREQLFQEVVNARRSALLGIDLTVAKLELAHQELKRDAHRVVTDLATREASAMRKIAEKEKKLYALQKSINEQSGAVLQKLKEIEMLEEETVLRCNARRHEIEAWATQLQKQFTERESELRLISRNVESDLGILFAARRRDVNEVAPTRHIHNFASITFRGHDLPRVVIDEPVRLEFAVSPHGPLVGMPVIMTYLEGRGGSIRGQVLTTVNSDGSIIFDDVTFKGPPGSSHVVLVSMARVAAGTIEGLELPVHLKAAPSVRASGSWNISDMSLTASLAVAGIEPFGLLGQSLAITLTHVPSGLTLETTSVASETNQFPFDFKIPAAAGLTWEDLSAGKVFIETHIPASKYTNPFFHKFQVICYSPAYPSFQFPPTEKSRECGLRTTGVDLPYSELVTDIALNDSGIVATADVAGTVSVYRHSDNRWNLKHRLYHDSFVSLLQWSPSGSHLALLEPKKALVQVWSLTDLLLRGEEIPASIDATARYQSPPGTTQMCPIPDAPLSCLISSPHGVRHAKSLNDSVDLLDPRTATVTLVRHAHLKRGGSVAFIGYADGEVATVAVSSRKLAFSFRMATQDPLVEMCVINDSKLAFASKKSVTVISSSPTWAALHCTFRSPSPLRSVALHACAPTSTTVLLLHDDGHICVLSIEDSRVLAFGSLPDVHGLSTVQSARTAAGHQVVACAALRPIAFQLEIIGASKLGVMSPDEAKSIASASQIEASEQGLSLEPVFEANFKKRSVQGAGNASSRSGGGAKSVATASSRGSTASTPRVQARR